MFRLIEGQLYLQERAPFRPSCSSALGVQTGAQVVILLYLDPSGAAPAGSTPAQRPSATEVREKIILRCTVMALLFRDPICKT